MWDKLDYCIIVSNDNETLHLKHHIGILSKLFGLDGKSIHIIDKGNSAEREEFYKTIPVKIHYIEIYKQPHHGEHLGSSYGYDVAQSYEYAVFHCGNKEFCFIAHPDMLILSTQLIEEYFQYMKDSNIGIIGECGHLFAIRREAYYQSPIGFTPMLGIQISKREHYDGYDTYCLRAPGDPRGIIENHICVGPDVGELLIIMTQMLGWKFRHVTDEWKRMMCHVGGGSGYWCNGNIENQDFLAKRQRATELFNYIIK